MPAQTNSNPITDSIETATENVTLLGDKALATSKKSSSALLMSYEKTVFALADSYVKAARSTNVEWISTVADVQAALARETAQSSASAARRVWHS